MKKENVVTYTLRLKVMWIGSNVTILKGVSIDCGCVIATGAVVTKNFPPYSYQRRCANESY